jgi:hypothetical protein
MNGRMKIVRGKILAQCTMFLPDEAHPNPPQGRELGKIIFEEFRNNTKLLTRKSGKRRSRKLHKPIALNGFN